MNRFVCACLFLLALAGAGPAAGQAAPRAPDLRTLSHSLETVAAKVGPNRRVRRGEIGVFAQTITPALASGLRLPREWEVVLGDVYPSSLAARAGLRINDVILSVEGKPMENGRQFDVTVHQRPIGDAVNIEVGRGHRSPPTLERCSRWAGRDGCASSR